MVLAISASMFVAAATSPGYVSRCGYESKSDTTRLMVKEYAEEAYPLWQRRHRDHCPDSLGDLNEYTNRKTALTAKDGVADINDAWGRPMRMSCTDETFEVRSAGEDGAFATEDDVTNCDANQSQRCVP